MGKATTWGAKWIVPVDRPPLVNGLLTVADGRVCSIQENRRQYAETDLGDVALLPGWINAHTHLEFSALQQPLGAAGLPITDWIPHVIRWRSEQDDNSLHHSLKQGLSETRETGTVAVGEIATHVWWKRNQDFDPLEVRVFAERLGADPSVATHLVNEAEAWLDPFDKRTRFLPGLSPHAPYSISDELLNSVLQLARKRSWPVAMHLAESLEELQFLRDGTGPFADLLESMQIPFRPTPGRAPLDYLQRLAAVDRALVIHGNFLSPEELDFLAKHKNLHLVFCPRTHRFFDHPEYPLPQILERGIPVSVGTDSRASNPDLNMLDELRSIRHRFPDLSPYSIIEMGTIHGAQTLGMESDLGTLSPGKRAWFQSYPIDGGKDPVESILDGDQDVLLTHPAPLPG